MKDFGLDVLSVDDHLALVERIWDSIAEGADLPAVSDAEKNLIDQRCSSWTPTQRTCLLGRISSVTFGGSDESAAGLPLRGAGRD